MASPVRISRTARAATITVVLAAFAVLPGCLQDSGEPGLFTGPSELVGTPVAPTPPPPAGSPAGPLVAKFTVSPAAPAAGQGVFFNGSDSTSPSGITTYAWDFGDGTTASGVSVTHPFSAAGTYVVRLSVTAVDGSVATVTQNVIVKSTAPSADPNASFSHSPTAPAVGDVVAFDASNSSAAAGRTIASYSWTFGDNTTGTGVTPTHTYSPSGEYRVVLTVTDDVGNTGTTSSPVSVGSPPAPGALFVASIVGLAVFFDGRTSTTQEGQTIVLYEWSFGDSTAIFTCDLVTGDGIGPDASDASCGATGDTISHTYAVAGDYGVTLVVTDSAGRTDAHSATITVP